MSSVSHQSSSLSLTETRDVYPLIHRSDSAGGVGRCNAMCIIMKYRSSCNLYQSIDRWIAKFDAAKC